MSREYQVFAVYMALKLHFNSNTYDFFKYNGKINISEEKFYKRKDKFHFIKIARTYTNRDELIEFFVANFLKKRNLWIKECTTPESHNTYVNWLKRKESLFYMFRSDCNAMLDMQNDDLSMQQKFDSLFTIKNGQHPTIIKLVLSNKISLETFLILNSIIRFIGKFNSQITDTVIWPDFYTLCLKYQPFLRYDVDKYTSALKKVLDIN